MKKVLVAYYSGTGGTARAAGCFAKVVEEKGLMAELHMIKAGSAGSIGQHDMLALLFPVHAWNAPEGVYSWLDSIGRAEEVPAAVLSVSGGGEITPNTASRLRSIKKLERKGYSVVYEEMFIMPNNWAAPIDEAAALLLLEALPQKVLNSVNRFLEGEVRRTRPFFIDRIVSVLGELEKPAARFFGRRIKVTNSCSSCGWCADSCPAGNITLEWDKPVFRGRCQMCLKCLYGCPEKALYPGIAKWVLIKEGYSLEELEKKLPYQDGPVDVGQMPKGQLWSGLRKYLGVQGK